MQQFYSTQTTILRACYHGTRQHHPEAAASKAEAQRRVSAAVEGEGEGSPGLGQGAGTSDSGRGCGGGGARAGERHRWAGHLDFDDLFAETSDQDDSDLEPESQPAGASQQQQQQQQQEAVAQDRQPARGRGRGAAPKWGQYSITVARVGQDLTPEDIEKYNAFVDSKFGRGYVGYEDGDLHGNLHGQNVAETSLYGGARPLNAAIKAAMCWDKADAGKTKVCVKSLQQVGLCMRTEHRLHVRSFVATPAVI